MLSLYLLIMVNKLENKSVRQATRHWQKKSVKQNQPHFKNSLITKLPAKTISYDFLQPRGRVAHLVGEHRLAA